MGKAMWIGTLARGLIRKTGVVLLGIGIGFIVLAVKIRWDARDVVSMEEALTYALYFFVGLVSGGIGLLFIGATNLGKWLENRRESTEEPSPGGELDEKPPES